MTNLKSYHVAFVAMAGFILQAFVGLMLCVQDCKADEVGDEFIAAMQTTTGSCGVMNCECWMQKARAKQSVVPYAERYLLRHQELGDALARVAKAWIKAAQIEGAFWDKWQCRPYYTDLDPLNYKDWVQDIERLKPALIELNIALELARGHTNNTQPILQSL